MLATSKLYRLCISRSVLFKNPTNLGTRNYRQIAVKENDNEITIEGVMHKDEDYNIAHVDVPEDTCPIRSRGIHITSEDVLILRQFITSDGEIIPKEVTGLCDLEHIKVTKAIKMAQRANLLPGEEDQTNEQGEFVPKLNRYLSQFQIGARRPIRQRGPDWCKRPYKFGEEMLTANAPHISNKPIKHMH